MDPERRLIGHLDNECGADHDEAGKENHEHRRPIAGIDEGIVEPAGLAARRNLQESMEQPAAAAARATAHQAREQRGHRRIGTIIGHHELLKKPHPQEAAPS